MRTLVLDLETVPLASSMAAPYPEADRPAPANYKDQEKIDAWRIKDEMAWREQRAKESSLTPRLGRIACLGWALGDDEPTTLVIRDEAHERDALELAWDRIGEASKLITFNGMFDLRFIAVRSIVHNLQPTRTTKVRDWFKRYTIWPHFDCRAVLTGWDDRQTGKLNEWCASFGIPCDDESSGADVYAFAQMGQWDAIAAHCKSDVSQTRELYRRISPLFL